MKNAEDLSTELCNLRQLTARLQSLELDDDWQKQKSALCFFLKIVGDNIYAKLQKLAKQDS